MRFTLQDIFNIPTAVIYNPDSYRSVTSVSIDSRSLKRNSLFVAIKGKNFDGHNFVNNAIKKGAGAVIINRRKLKDFDNVKIPLITVRNTTDAYAELAKIWRNKFNGKIISITGSNGKTTTKEILAQLLSSKYKVHKTHSNNNNHIGVPLTILSASPYADFIVLEHGTNHIGEIEYTAKIAKPDYALITNIGDSHVEFLGTKKNILKEKISLFDHCRKDGNVFINSDDPLLSKQTKVYTNNITYGFRGKCDVKGRRLSGNGYLMEKISIAGFGKKVETYISLLGRSNSQNFLAAACIAMKLGITKKDIAEQSKKIINVKGRLELIQFPDFKLIDDTYNSNPDSVKIAVELLSKFKGARKKILLFGDMFELGRASAKHHSDMAELINKKNIDEVYTIGKKSKILNQKLNTVKTKKHFSNRKSLMKYIKHMALDNSLILVKGSRGMQMEEFVDQIKKQGN